MVLGLLGDLFFSARIRETAKQLGVECEILRDPAALLARARERSPRLVIVDMNFKAGDPAQLVRDLKADEQIRGTTVVGYLHDAHDELIRAARSAGCDRVLSRGGLTKQLPDLVAEVSPARGP